MPRSRSTRTAILAAARELIVGDEPPTMGAVAARAGVSRLTVYQHFGSHRGLLEALAGVAQDRPPTSTPESMAEAVRAACERWASDPILFRRLPGAAAADSGSARDLAGTLAAADGLRPGCSIREAEDVIAVVTSFAAFDRLYQDGRRSVSAVAEILCRMGASVLSPS